MEKMTKLLFLGVMAFCCMQSSLYATAGLSLMVEGDNADYFAKTKKAPVSGLDQKLRVQVLRNTSQEAKKAEESEDLSRYEKGDNANSVGDVSSIKREVVMLKNTNFQIRDHGNDEIYDLEKLKKERDSLEEKAKQSGEDFSDEINEINKKIKLFDSYDKFPGYTVIAQRGTCIKLKIEYENSNHGIIFNFSNLVQDIRTAYKFHENCEDKPSEKLRFYVSHYDSDENGKVNLIQVGKLLKSTNENDIYDHVVLNVRASNIVRLIGATTEPPKEVQKMASPPVFVSLTSSSYTASSTSAGVNYGELIPSNNQIDDPSNIVNFDKAFILDKSGNREITAGTYAKNPNLYDVQVSFSIFIYNKYDMSEFYKKRDNSSLRIGL